MELLKRLAYRGDDHPVLDFNYQNGWCVNEQMLMESFLHHTGQQDFDQDGAQVLLAEEFGILPQHVNLETHLPWLCQNYLRWLNKNRISQRQGENSLAGQERPGGLSNLRTADPVVLFMSLQANESLRPNEELERKAQDPLRLDLVTAYHQGFIHNQDINDFRELLTTGTLSMEITDYVLDFTQYPPPKDPETWSSYFCSSDCLHMESIAQKLDDPGIFLCTVEHNNHLEQHQGITLNRVNVINDSITGNDRFSGDIIVNPSTINELRQGGKVFYFGNMKYHTKMFRLHYLSNGSTSGKYLDTVLSGSQRRSWKHMCLTTFPHLL